MHWRTIQLDDAHFRVAEEKAQILGMTPAGFVRHLIDAEDALGNLSFDELLAPVRKGFEHLSDDRLDALFTAAQKRTASEE